MSHHFTTGGADSSKGDFLPSPSGGPLVRFLGPEFVLCIAQSSHEFTWRLRTGFAYASTIAPWILQIGLVFSWSWYCLYCVCFFRILCCSTGSFIPTRLRKDIQTVGEELGYAHPSAGQLRFGRVWQSLMWNDMQIMLYDCTAKAVTCLTLDSHAQFGAFQPQAPETFLWMFSLSTFPLRCRFAYSGAYWGVTCFNDGPLLCATLWRWESKCQSEMCEQFQGCRNNVPNPSKSCAVGQ